MNVSSFARYQFIHRESNWMRLRGTNSKKRGEPPNEKTFPHCGKLGCTGVMVDCRYSTGKITEGGGRRESLSGLSYHL